ncbi:FcoT family thioesterase [Allokutzneria sp. A3M-2-11 16]|uniref:FcoT family thioesterase n=1 Tax=Allokutzneria sp. A3M-2-11 16 TaxID=2962043 RepID=UPI0020B645F5|nr:FcoT family thioesterase [Allokutzneria sp. A3M-2-11 16]MCP3804807.1 FcoT family thioesterase [Allokutzneria sp. A3M-2-11 16]
MRVRRGHRTEEDLLREVLRVYKPHCRYVKEIGVSTSGRLSATAVLEIPESCYIDDTGHLNAAEVNICFNQMLYHLVAYSVKHRAGEVFGDWTMADFRRRQLADIVITRFACAFRRPIDPLRFQAELVVERVARRGTRRDGAPLVLMETAFRFWDEGGGAASGNAQVILVETGGPSAPGAPGEQGRNP